MKGLADVRLTRQLDESARARRRGRRERLNRPRRLRRPRGLSAKRLMERRMRLRLAASAS